MLSPEEAQAKAKELGHCLCNLKIKCPCVAWTKLERCECARKTYHYEGSVNNLYQPPKKNGKFFRLIKLFFLIVWIAIGIIILKFLITNYF